MSKCANLDFRYLIDPVDTGTFGRVYWEKQPLIVRRTDGNYYRGLLSLESVDSILSTSSIRPPQIRLLNEGKETPLKQLRANRLGSPAVLLESVYDEYRNGSTIVLQFLHERWKPLTDLCRSLAAELSAYFQVNAYLTPPNEKGLNTHYDAHDVFVLQLEGSKHWRLYRGPIHLPLPGQTYSPQTEPGELVAELDLNPGELIYIPRGFMHDAVSVDSTSLHLTLGVIPVTWAAVVLQAAESVIEEDARFRESLPLGFAANAELKVLAENRLAELLTLSHERIEPVSFIEKATEKALLGRQPLLEGHLLDLEGASRLNIETKVWRRLNLQWRLTMTGKDVLLHFHGKIVQVPAHVESTLRFITEAEQFVAADLPGDLDDSGKLVLLQRLIREGFLTLCQPMADGRSSFVDQE
jgi:ribosomal protein L16 Arg81 hydroxylase